MVSLYERTDDEDFILTRDLRGSSKDREAFGYAVALGGSGSLVVGAPASSSGTGRSLSDWSERRGDEAVT